MKHILIYPLILITISPSLKKLELPNKITLSQYIAYEALANSPFDLHPQRLTLQQEARLIKKIPDWHIDRTDTHRLRNTFIIKNTTQFTEFVNHIKKIAFENKLYLQAFTFDRTAYVELYNPYIGGLSRNEFILASRISMLYSLFYRNK